MDLNGTWKLQDFAPGAGVRAGAHEPDLDDSGWLDVAVPGDVHRALIAAGRIPDPFYDRNEPACAWVEEREWWYRLRFQGPAEPLGADERLRLVFEGLDTFATLWLNGHEVGHHGNMFREAAFDVSALVRPGEANTLALRFDRPKDHARAPEEFALWGDNALDRVAIRKAQFGYGWDWGPRLPTVGIWRPVRLWRERRAALAGVHAYTLEIDRACDQALVAVRVEADAFAAAGPLSAEVTLTAPDGAAVRQAAALTGEPGRPTATLYLTVRHPQLWWTHDLGTPALYRLDVELHDSAEPVATHSTQVGIRTIALDQSPDPDEPGARFFRFVLNGVPLFAKGADWIPADSFVGAIPPERYAMLLGAARDANMNMLRLWGGGIYEHDVFYDLCDRLGLLVWQDFMFACAMYPEDEAFAAEVRAEARYQVRRLRNHPCLALWCGNNENQWIHSQVFWDRADYHVPGCLYYDRILPETVAELDGHVPYWPGSPYGGSDYNSAEDGDTHNWHVWHGLLPRRFGEPSRHINTPENVSYVHYAEDMGRFISEFGMHAAPVLETLRRAMPADQLYHHSPAMDHHNKDNPKNKGDNLMRATTGLPRDLEEYIDLSMLAQAEGLKFGIEHFRRRKPHCSGTLFWQLNDCWPVLSWSVIDYYGFGKAGYYYARRAYAPVLASFKPLEDGGLELWLTNDTLQEVADTVRVRLATFAGELLWQGEREVRVGANESRPVWCWQAGELPGGPDRYVAVRSQAGLFPANRHFFALPKDLERTPPPLDVHIEQAGAHELRVRLRAPAYAYFVHLFVPDEATRYSDNYFDLEPGEERVVTIRNDVRPLAPEMVTVRAR